MQFRMPVPATEGGWELCGSKHHLPFGQQPLLCQLREVTEAQSVREVFLNSAQSISGLSRIIRPQEFWSLLLSQKTHQAFPQFWNRSLKRQRKALSLQTAIQHKDWTFTLLKVSAKEKKPSTKEDWQHADALPTVSALKATLYCAEQVMRFQIKLLTSLAFLVLWKWFSSHR